MMNNNEGELQKKKKADVISENKWQSKQWKLAINSQMINNDFINGITVFLWQMTKSRK